MKKIDVLIIGAGAAGLMCAIEAGKRGRRVYVLDHANKAGKKILMSGGGRCNFTNLDVQSYHYISHNPQFCKSALSRYTPQHFIDLVKKHAIPFHEKTLGQLFCDHKSKDILNMLLIECEWVKVAIQLDTVISAIEQQDNGLFHIATNKGDYECESLVIATGGLSIPTMGASAFGYNVARQFGINVWPTRAGLVPFTLQSADQEKVAILSGISVECAVFCNQQSFTENMLFTHRGLSGPAMLQISSYWHGGDPLTINLMPHHDLFELLKTQHQAQLKISLKNSLTPYFAKRLVSAWLDDDYEHKTLQDCSYKQLKEISDRFQNWQITPSGTQGYSIAEVTLGGVDCDAISSKTFETKHIKGLYFIGEVLDVTGWLGGYNFQWAWSSGFAAGSVA